MLPSKNPLPLVACVLLLSACSSDDSTSDQPSSLVWRSCTDDSALECATLKVSSDYGDAQAGQIDIALNRLPAIQQPATKSLLFNPGGPGGSGVEALEVLTAIDTIPESVRQQYDLIGFDPRGIGGSTPVGCSEFGIEDTGIYLRTTDDFESFVQDSTEIASRCSEKYGDYLQQLGSLNVVRDMESIRIALGADKLNFIGYSYGTRLGALYLQTYPDNSGAFVLDGSLRPVNTVAPLAEGALLAMQRNLEAMLQQCTRTDPDCQPEVLQQLLLDKVETLLNEGRESEFELVGDLVVSGSQNPAFGSLLIAPLMQYLQQGDTSGLLVLVQLLNSPSDEDDEGDGDNTTAQNAVMCADDAYRPTTTELLDALPRFNAISDLFAEAYIGQAGVCAGWPEAIEPLAEIATGTAPAALVIGGTSDAQTPIAWSEEMANAIGGYYLASSHDGHTSVYNEESECVDAAVTAFLLDGLLPTGTDCL